MPGVTLLAITVLGHDRAGIIARALQHEIDHCDGRVFLDRAAGAHAIYARRTYL